MRAFQLTLGRGPAARSIGLVTVCALVALVAGCGRGATLDLRSADAWRSVVVVSGPVSSPSAFALDLTETKLVEIPSIDSDDVPVLLLYYALPLGALGLAPGALDGGGKGTRGHLLPIPQAARAIDASRAVLDVTQTATASTLFRAFLVPDSGEDACVPRGGCYLRGTGGLCALPCPALEPVVAPTLPDLPRFACEDWPRVRASQLGSSAPESEAIEVCPAPSAESCPEGQAAVPDRGCFEVQTPCSGWAAGLPVDAIHVRSGATEGDGSEGSPFGSIAEALARVEGVVDSPVLALAPGAFEEDLTLGGPVRIVGCASTIHGLVRVAGGAVELESLRLAAGAQSVLQVDAGASARLMRVRVDPSRTGTSSMTIAGSATIAEALVDLGAGSIRVEPTGQLSFVHTDLRNQQAPLLLASGGRVRAMDAALSSGFVLATSVVDLVDADVELSRVRLEVGGDGENGEDGGDATALSVRGRSTGQLERVTLASGPHVKLVHVTDDARIRGSEIVGIGGTKSLYANGRADLVLSDVLAVGAEDGIFASGSSKVDFTRVLALNVGSHAIWLGDRTTSSISDATIVGASIGVAAWAASSVTARRLRIVAAEAKALVSTTDQAFFSDVTIQRSSLVGLQTYRDLLSQRPRASLTMERLSVFDSAGSGVWIAQGSEARLRDLRVERIAVATTGACATGGGIGEALCGGEAVRLGTDTSGRLERFELLSSSRGIVFASARFDVTSGHVGTNETGLIVVDEDRGPEELLDRVLFSDNGVDVVIGFKE